MRIGAFVDRKSRQGMKTFTSGAVVAFVGACTFLVALPSCGGSGGGGSGGDAGGTVQANSAPGPQMPLVSLVPLSGNPVAIENAKEGTSDWKLANPAVAGEIEGYASLTSVNKGGTINFHVNTTAAAYDIDIYRMGYYGGKRARLMQSFANVARQSQPLPCAGHNHAIECNWHVSKSLTIPAPETGPVVASDWPSGVYLAKLTTHATPKKDSYIIFVVRDDKRPATYVSLLPVTTYQAYNYWGGKSLYTGCAVQSSGWSCANGAHPVPAVSFNRPYGPGNRPSAAYGTGAGEFLTNVQPDITSSAGWDYNMVRWMERQGYDVKYITNVDLHEDSGVLNQAKAFVAMGHDEYYSRPMWNRLMDARNAGINLAFFSGNNIFWQMRFEDGAYGARKNRVMITYRGGGDPVRDNELTTDQFRYLGRPEAALIGGQYVTNPVMGDITITDAAHWLFSGSGAVNGMALKGLLGYEINAVTPGISPDNTKVLAHSVFNGFPGDVSFYVAPSSSQVFATGTIQWSWGLDGYITNGERQDYTSTVAQAITANVFDAIAEKYLSTFTSQHSGFDLSTPAGTLDPVQVVQNPKPANASKLNQWRILPTEEQHHFLVVSRANGLCLDAYAATDGATVGTYDCNMTGQQKWRLIDQGNGTVSISDKRSGRCLEAPVTGGANLGLTIAGCRNAANQQWRRIALN